MWKVIIVDDEPKVTLLLQKIVDWEELGFQIAGTAQDGICALELIRDELPDLVVTDIRMPGCDGMELIRQAKEMKEDITFIVVSGYKQFEYAHTALKYGVEDYLLKPVKADELTSLLKQIREKKEQQAEQEEWKETVSKRIQKDNQRDRWRIIRDLKNCAEKRTAFLNLYETNQEYGCDFSEGIYQVILIRLDIPNAQESMGACKIVAKHALAAAEKYAVTFTQKYAAAIDDEGIILLMQSGGHDFTQVKKYLIKTRKEIENQRDLFREIVVSAVIGRPVTHTEEIPDTLREVMYLSKDRILRGKKEWLKMVEEPGVQEEIFQMPVFLRKSLQEAGECLNHEKFCRDLDIVKNTILDFPGLSGQAVYECFIETVDACLRGLRQNEKFDEEQVRQDLKARYHMCVSLEDVFLLLKDQIGKLFEIYISQKEKEEMRPITEAKKYIQEHYREPLKLEEVSRIIGFNATYFSTVFKKKTGKGFLDYLTEIRMNKAKQLLCRDDMSINDVAEEVGYKDLKYFTRLFKKATGIAPSEYKKLYQ